MDATTFLVSGAVGGVVGGFLMFLYGLYLTADSFRDRVTWTDKAGRLSKAWVLTDYTLRHADWHHAPRVVGTGVAIGAGVVWALGVVGTGLYHIFVV